MNVSMYIRGRTPHVRDCAYIRSHDMPNVLFLVLIYGDIPFNAFIYYYGVFMEKHDCVVQVSS